MGKRVKKFKKRNYNKVLSYFFLLHEGTIPAFTPGKCSEDLSLSSPLLKAECMTSPCRNEI